jgi:hypothetical protein
MPHTWFNTVKSSIIYSSLYFCFWGSTSLLLAQNNSLQGISETPVSVRTPVQSSLAKRYTRDATSLICKYPSYEKPETDNYLPLNLIRTAVQKKADARWSEYAIGEPIPCCDYKGKLVCYQVPVALMTREFPKVLTAPPAREINESDLHSADLWAISEFWTFVVSARESDYPIFVHYQGLPPILVTYSKAQEVAQNILHTSELELLKYVSMGHDGDYYLIESMEGQQVALDAYTLDNKTEIVLRRMHEAGEANQTSADSFEVQNLYQEQVREAWDLIKAKDVSNGSN